MGVEVDATRCDDDREELDSDGCTVGLTARIVDAATGEVVEQREPGDIEP